MKTVLLIFLLPLLAQQCVLGEESVNFPDRNAILHSSSVNGIAISDLQSAAQDGLREIENMIELEKRLFSDGLISNKNKCPGRRNVLEKKRSSNQSRQKTVEALGVVEASKKLKERINLNENEAGKVLPKLSLRDTVLEKTCPETIACPTVNTYRSFDGSCNNLMQPSWGQRDTIFQRLLPAHYGNGIDSPRLASDGSELKNAREISIDTIRIYGLDETANVTLAVMSFGQFITHDITLSEDFTFENGSSPACCDAQGQLLPPNDMHPQCLPIEIKQGDIFYDFNGINCMSFTRSKVGLDSSCTFGIAEQLNTNSHYLDGSQIYGSDVTTSNDLRSGVGGLMKMSNVDGRELFPIAPGCENQPNHELAVCFQAGDVRVEENPQLAAIQLIFLREHNRIAKELQGLNPQWDDETLFQEARRIVIAQLQHITYNEYLPSLLGSQVMADSGLALPSIGYGNGYDVAIDPSVSNDFTAAAFRVTHSSIQGFLYLLDAADQEDTERSFSLSQYFFDSSRLVDDPEFLDSALRGLTKQPPQAIDALYSSEVTSNLYIGQKAYGSDLVAITIQRGREHGIPGYNQFREFCGMQKVESFDELIVDFFPENIDLLRAAYKSVDDIDLYIGALLENHLTVYQSGALMGPIALCITANQFQRTKNGDRYFYDIGGQPHSFTLDQLNQIRRSSLARLICDNNDGSVTNMQPLAMIQPIETNQRVPCDSIPSMDLTYWKEI
ncbi:peroxidase-like [Daphnia pulicaria]|uniref:peroxidase-like n=1 Tax=Daphnia pulicaria TaxID=35523 RepID=UPI001EEB35C5|nr:peroxidase-like [Daphnia pulicaria]